MNTAKSSILKQSFSMVINIKWKEPVSWEFGTCEQYGLVHWPGRAGAFSVRMHKVWKFM